MNKIIFGCKPSVLTGKEQIYSAANSKLPATYSYLSVMPPIEDQGQAPKCVAYSTCAWLDWRKNIAEHDNNGDQFDVDKIYNCRADKSAQGMQIIEAMHFLKNSQDKVYHIKGYAKVGSIEQLKSSLIANGPALCGMPVRSYNSDFWKELGEQTQRDVGTEFKERVDNEDYPNIKFFDKTSDGRNWYQKIK